MLFIMIPFPIYQSNKNPKQGGRVVLIIPPLCLLSFHILLSVGLLFPLFPPQDTLIERFPLDGQFGVLRLRLPCLCRDCALAVYHAFQIVLCRCKQDLPGFGQLLLSLVLEINVGLWESQHFCRVFKVIERLGISRFPRLRLACQYALNVVGKGGRLGVLLFLFQPILQFGDTRL